MYLEVKMEQNGRNKVFRGKQTTSKVSLMSFQTLQCLKKSTTNNFRRCKQTNKVRRMYLEFKKLDKIRK